MDQQFQLGAAGGISPFAASGAYDAGLHGQGMRDITAGDNWYDSAGPGWDAATGLGEPGIVSLAKALGK